MRTLALSLLLATTVTPAGLAAGVDLAPPEMPCDGDAVGCAYHLLGCAFILFLLDPDGGVLGDFLACFQSTGS
jgi:hypothetical protein